MNILEQTEALKDLPDQALIKEMQMPTGIAAPIFITTELKRRQRIRDEFKRREAQDMPTVAEEVVMAAGVPQQGIMQMAKSMAPKTNMGQNTGMASMMPKQPTMGMSSGGVVKMQPGGKVPFYGLERKVFEGQEYFTDGNTVYKQYESGQIDVVRDPEIVTAVTSRTPSAQTEVDSISSVLDADKPVGSMSSTIDPTIDRSALDPVLGIRPEMIPQFPDQGNPLFSSDRDTQKAISEIAGTEDLTPTRDTYRPFLQNQPQDRELLLPTAQPTGRQSLDGRMVSTVGPTAAEIERAQKVLEMNPGLTTSDEELDVFNEGLKRNTALQNFLNRDPEEDSELGLNRPKVANQFTGRQSLDGQVVSTVGPTAAELENAQKVLELNPGVSASDEELEVLGEGLKRNTALQNFLKRNPEEDLGLFPTSFNTETSASEPYLQNKNPLFIGGNTKTNMPVMQQFRVQGGLDPILYSDDLLPPKKDAPKEGEGSLEAAEKFIKDLDKQDKTTTVNKAAEVVLGTVGKETLAAASGAQGPQAAAQAQQGFSDKQWLDIAALGMMISSGNPADLREASKLFIKLQEASRGRKSKEKMAAEDRASREKVAGIRAKATQENTAARIRSATLNRDFRVLDSIETRLQEDIAKLMPLNPKDPVAPENKDAYDTLTRQLAEVRKAIRNLGTFDLGPGSGETEIAGSYNVVGT